LAVAAVAPLTRRVLSVSFQIVLAPRPMVGSKPARPCGNFSRPASRVGTRRAELGVVGHGIAVDRQQVGGVDNACRAGEATANHGSSCNGRYAWQCGRPGPR
jgi:hypothetical protein